jgi:hypothetical protein
MGTSRLQYALQQTRSRMSSGPRFHLAGLPRFTCKQRIKRRGWDSNPRDDLTPPTRFPILGATLQCVSPRTDIRPSNATNQSCGRQRRSIAYRPVPIWLQYGCSKWQCGKLEGKGGPDNIVDGAHAPRKVREASTARKVYWRSPQQTLGMIWNRL